MAYIEIKNVSKSFEKKRVRSSDSTPEKTTQNPSLSKAAFRQHMQDIEAKKKTYAVKNFDLTIEKGDFVVLLGPSGCGKTTLLRMLAGLEFPDTGEVICDGVDITFLKPEKRNMAMVFQDYALYPHMTVFENIAFPLKIAKTPNEEISRRVNEVCRVLGIDALTERKPNSLSGGQKQRVAICRALIREPDVFLMDEPLSNLDTNLKVQMREELSRIHKENGATIVYVTHDQVEAMTLATKIVVLENGTIRQVGTTHDLYYRPSNLFVARFVGNPQMNTFLGSLEEGVVQFFGQTILFHEYKSMSIGVRAESIVVGIRPEDIIVKFENGQSTASDAVLADSTCSFRVSLMRMETTGADAYLHFMIDKEHIVARINADRVGEVSEKFVVVFRKKCLLLFNKTTGQLLG